MRGWQVKADSHGLKRKSHRECFRKGWESRDWESARQIRGIAESYMTDIRLLQERVELARWERDELKKRAVPEGYIVLAEAKCTLPGEEPEVTYVVVNEESWNKAISEIGECCDGEGHE